MLKFYRSNVDLSLYSVDLITGLIWMSFDYGEKFSYKEIKKELMK